MVSRPLPRIDSLTKTFPREQAQDSVSLRVSSGEIMAVVGHNRSGKSTLANILAGVRFPDLNGPPRSGTDGGWTVLAMGAGERHRPGLSFFPVAQGGFKQRFGTAGTTRANSQALRGFSSLEVTVVA
jgi:energy-coupling factor transporter ATP-binding protein EcfA2